MLLWLDGFDWVTSGSFLQDRYGSTLSSFSGTVSPAAFGVSGISLTGPLDFTTPELVPSPSVGNGDRTCILGAHVKHSNAFLNQVIHEVRLGALAQVKIRLQRRQTRRGDYNIVYENSTGQTLASIGPFYYNQWYYIEHEININTAGVIRTWVDGMLYFELENVNTQGSFGFGWDRIHTELSGGSAIDNLYIADARQSATDLTARPFGPMVVNAVVPDEVTLNDWDSAFTPEASLGTLDGDVSYVEADAADETLSVKFSEPIYSQSGRIAGIQFFLHGRDIAGAPANLDVKIGSSILATPSFGSTYTAANVLATSNDADGGKPFKPDTLDLQLDLVSQT